MQLKFLIPLFSALALSAPSWAGTNVGISVNVVQPGVYGQIVIGNAPPPPVVVAQPVIVAPAPVVVAQEPIYLYVPTVYQRNWPRYCGRYNACGRPVLFVQEQWVREHHGHHDDDDDEGGHRHGPGHHGHDHDHGRHHGDD